MLQSREVGPAPSSVEEEQAGRTLYLPIALNRTVPPKVGVYVPAAVSSSASELEVVVYFHGHIIPACKTQPQAFQKGGIEYYWSTPFFRVLRRGLENSGRRAILIAPTLTTLFGVKGSPPDKSGDFQSNGKLDYLIDKVLEALKGRGLIAAQARPSAIVLAGHSAGGLPMQAAIAARNRYRSLIGECLGFECLYFGTGKWDAWLKADAKHRFRHFRRADKQVAATRALRGNRNFIDTQGASGHCESVPEFWGKAIGATRSKQGTAGDSSDSEWPNYEAAAPTGSKPAGANGMKRIELYGVPIEIAKARCKGSAPAVVKEAPSAFLPVIVDGARKLAIAAGDTAAASRLDGQKWFSQMVQPPFMGQTFAAGQYVHTVAAEQLRKVEDELKAKFGATALQLRRTLLGDCTDAIAGSRGKSATATFSMHMFGLAVDLNYWNSLYLRKHDLMNAILGRASALLGISRVPHWLPLDNSSRPNKPDLYAAVEKVSNTLRVYFRLLDDQGSLSSRVAGATAKPWAGSSIADAMKLVQKDLDLLLFAERVSWSAYNSSNKQTAAAARTAYRQTSDAIKKYGLLSFHRDFVESMSRHGFQWGASYGDIMHFDLRKKGTVGAYIEQSRLQYKAAANARAKAKCAA